MIKDTLICIRDCYSSKFQIMYYNYPIKKGTLVQDYHEGHIYAGVPNTWIICVDGYQLVYDKHNFKVLSEHRLDQIDKICG